MEDEGLIEETMLPPPASTEGYRLTEFGQDLEPVIVALGQWGLKTLGRPDPDDTFNPEWLLISLEGFLQPEAAEGLREVHEYRIDETIFHTRIRDGTITTTLGPAPDPTFTLETDSETFLAVMTGAASWSEAFDDDRGTLKASREAFDHLDSLFDVSDLEASFSS